MHACVCVCVLSCESEHGRMCPERAFAMIGRGVTSRGDRKEESLGAKKGNEVIGLFAHRHRRQRATKLKKP